jgi:N-acyl homoserine lactone hydrolase
MVRKSAALLAALLALVTLPAVALDKPASPRLYALDCGSIEFKTLGMFADGDEYATTPGTLADPCFLIVHPKGVLLWDTGIGDAIADKPDGVTNAKYGIHMTVPRTLKSQLQQLGMAPADVDFVGLSHLHFDHASNLQQFPDATWIISPAELKWASSTPTPVGVDPRTFAGNEKRSLRGNSLDDDLFGDGSVRILRAPGHTPGHKVLMLQLKNAGTVILSGDLYHTRDNFRQQRVPPINDSRADTMASFDRVRRLMETHEARLVIQHSPEDFAALPKFPSWLD